jgi:acyl carrier protein
MVCTDTTATTAIMQEWGKPGMLGLNAIGISFEPTALEKLLRIIARETGVDRSSLKSSTHLLELRIDSLDFLELMQVIGNEFSTSLSDEQIAPLKTIGDVLKAVTKA